MTIDEIIRNSKDRMAKAVESFKHGLNKIRTGRAHPSLVEHLKINSYGSDVPLLQMASVAVKDQRTLSITPWDRNMIQAIEKAIMQSDLGLNPNTSGTVIYVPLPPLTEERRKELVKVVKVEGENARVNVRNIRRDANNDIKKLFSEKKISEDDERRAQDNIQKMTDGSIAEIDKILNIKEKELLEV
jgi:ribosome recycling factor